MPSNPSSDLRALYETCWALPAYRTYSPGEEALPLFGQMVNPGGTLADIGCGTGRAGAHLSEAFDVTLIDFAKNALDPGIQLPFLRADITKRIPGRYDYGYCCDVMEHIEPKKVDKVLSNLFEACSSVFFSIHFGPDNFGRLVGHPLHLTQECFAWWRDKLKGYGELVDARDLLGHGVFYVDGGHRVESL